MSVSEAKDQTRGGQCALALSWYFVLHLPSIESMSARAGLSLSLASFMLHTLSQTRGILKLVWE